MTTAVLVVLLLLALVGAGVWAWRRGHLAHLQLLLRRGAVALARTELPPAAEIVVPGELPVAQPRPVVLVHGILGFDQIRVPGLKVDYFRGIARHLDSCGVVIHTVRLPKLGSVPARAKILADFILALEVKQGDGKVDVIAHSLGGLDARWAIAHLGLAGKVASLVTIGTPHRGTPVADLAKRGPFDLARKLIGKVGLDTAALDWLTTESLERFNREVPDAPGVRYACVVAGAREPSTRIPLALLPVHAYIRRKHGANDGLVTVESQVWGEVLGEIEADHWAQVGWYATLRRGFDATAFYANLIARLQGRALPAGPDEKRLLLPAPSISSSASPTE
jgi:triacylglycerol lipase